MDIENRFMDMGRREKRVKCMERVTWKLTLTYVKYVSQDSQGKFAVGLRKLKQGLCINLEVRGWGGIREGGSKGRGYLYTYG